MLEISYQLPSKGEPAPSMVPPKIQQVNLMISRKIYP